MSSTTIAQQLADLHFGMNKQLVKEFIKWCIVDKELKKSKEIYEDIDELFLAFLKAENPEFNLSSTLNIVVDPPKKTKSVASKPASKSASKSGDDVREPGKCSHKFITGKNSGKFCTAKIYPEGDGDHCKLHQPKEKEQCCGTKKDGTACNTTAKNNVGGQMFCGRHTPKDGEVVPKKAVTKKKVIRDSSESDSDDESTSKVSRKSKKDSESEDDTPAPKIVRKTTSTKSASKSDSDSEDDKPKMVRKSAKPVAKSPIDSDSEEEVPSKIMKKPATKKPSPPKSESESETEVKPVKKPVASKVKQLKIESESDSDNE